MLGLPKGIVKLEPHSEQWRQLFAEEATRIREVVGEYVLAIEHVGSTSINGIAAKPIIDMAVSVEKATDGEMCIAPLENIGTSIAANTASRGVFISSKASRARIIASGYSQQRFLAQSFIVPRYLQANRSAAKEYEKLKIDLAENFLTIATLILKANQNLSKIF
jgi:GrpB-like predicted nucleotidyltransferase (UPF0157 family)